MPKIVPQRLRDIRTARRLTQGGLARKSPLGLRQIQRIESSHEEHVTVREKTLFNLAKGLSVDIAVLAGDSPMDAELSSALARTKEQPKRNDAGHLEEVELRLLKLDAGYAIVEFSRTNTVGTIIARDIPTEDAGRRLTSYGVLRDLLTTAHAILEDPDAIYWTEFDFLIHEAETALSRPLRQPTAVAHNEMGATEGQNTAKEVHQ